MKQEQSNLYTGTDVQDMDIIIVKTADGCIVSVLMASPATDTSTTSSKPTTVFQKKGLNFTKQPQLTLQFIEAQGYKNSLGHGKKGSSSRQLLKNAGFLGV